MSGHTLGPWEVRQAITPTDGEFDFGIGAVVDGKPVCIAEVFGRVAINIRPPAEANARLIASAPDVLAALKELSAALDEATDCLDVETAMGSTRLAKAREAASTAIAKAEGEP